jgi:hypothetical protein
MFRTGLVQTLGFQAELGELLEAVAANTPPWLPTLHRGDRGSLSSACIPR